jgi:fructose-1-phosphate kinase PfkB-like protein
VNALRPEKKLRCSAPVFEPGGGGINVARAICFFYFKGKNLHEALRYGVVCGTAATLNSGIGLCKKENVERLNEEIKINSIHQHLLKATLS